MTPRPVSLPSLLLLATVAGDLCAQSNTIVGRDIQLSNTWAIARYRRTGTFPIGVQAIGAWTTCCNPGTSPIPFQAAMSPNHGFIHFIVARESDGRLVQISDWSYVKHTFGSSNDPSSCGSCAGPGNFNRVEVGCSDTYANSQAVDHFNLGPPDEVDPWLGTWVPACSYFDRGDPAGGPSTLCDGVRSLTQTQANTLNLAIGHAMRVHDVDLNVPGASFYYQSGYLVPSEAEANRTNNIGSRQFTPTWGGTEWNLNDGPTFLQGTILQRWSGASLSSNTNGTDDGRYYVAVKVTGPVSGLYHYEYAVHNRDNKRGMGAFRIPVCSTAQVSGFGFHDIDQSPRNTWSGSKVGAEIVFSTTDNPLHWNSIFNFWFDCDAAPTTGATLLDQFAVGAGQLTVPVTSTTPGGVFNVNLGAGCGTPEAPNLHAIGTPDRASIPNASFALRSTGNYPAAMCGFVLVLAPGATVLAPGCTLYAATVADVTPPLMLQANLNGVVVMPLGVPADPALEGTSLDFQMASFAPTGSFLGQFNLSNGLRVRIGSTIGNCQ